MTVGKAAEFASTARTNLQIARLLGAGWATNRVRGVADRKSGALERSSPIAAWVDLIETAGPLASFHFDEARSQRLALWLATEYKPTDIAVVRHEVERLIDGEFAIFGEWCEMPTWTTDPQSGFRFSDDHWAKVQTPSGVDVKRVWEPSRFGWLVPLARAHLLGLDDLAPLDVMSEIFDSWCDDNQPNSGINWSCGQESSLRLILLTAILEVVPANRFDPDLLRAFVAQTGRRVEAHIDYARSQKNNHHLSEALGLLTAGLLLDESDDSVRWIESGTKQLEIVARTLVSADGSTSQNSMNYHRLFVQGFTWGVHVLERHGRPVPSIVRQALERTSRFQRALVDPATGGAPVFGNDDGADLFRFDLGTHRDFRGCVQAASAVLDEPSPYPAGPWDETALWLTGELTDRDQIEPSQSQLHVDGGIALASREGFRVSMRGGDHQFRPAHADQLHVDVWWEGVEVAIDRGTFGYHASGAWVDAFSGSEHHNTVLVDGQGQMRRLSKFVWGPRWSGGHLAIDGSTILGDHDSYRAAGVAHSRRVDVFDDRVEVVDTLTSAEQHEYELRWNLADHPFEVDDESVDLLLGPKGRVVVRLQASPGWTEPIKVVRADLDGPVGWRAIDYLQLQPCLSVRAVTAGRAIELRTSFELGS